MPNIILIGAGLAGSLLSIYLARRGFTVDLYERRPDMRKTRISAGRSINLALSTRGLHALKDVGLHDTIMKIAIPMKGRMIHPPSGEFLFQRYGRDDSEVIYATSRAYLNIALLDAAERYAGVRITFNKRCVGMDLESGDVLLQDENSGEGITVRGDTVIGTDGSASAIRMELQKTGRFNLSQSYLEYGYKELVIPPGPGGSFLLEKNALHIWPRTTYMLIALPNIDGSFTCTLFFPFEGELSFESLKTPDDVITFFEQQFPDALPLMPTLADDFFGNPTGSMVTIKCSPWFYKNKVALLGDAAHAIVPFFGQGMNCAFEDCTILDEILGRREERKKEACWEAIYAEYEHLRKVNTDAIADLALENFVEMRDLVAQPKFQLKKRIEQALQSRWPDRFIPKYSMVTFHRIPYSIALQKGIIQEQILSDLCKGIERPEQIDWTHADHLIKQYLGH
jgi:kynurenine 3-monooxygenase